MPRRPRKQDVGELVERINATLLRLNQPSDGEDLRAKVLRLVEVQHDFRDLGVSIVHEGGIEATAARDRIRLYFIEYVGTALHSDELQVVSGITDYPRRIRELRVEHGYQIASGASPDREAGIDLLPEQYLLVTESPDSDAARRWHIANRIRRQPGKGSRDRLLEFLSENIGHVVTTEELSYVAKNASEFGRRVRELRREDGYLIATKFTGRPDLSMGQYVLESLDRTAKPHDRRIPDPIQRTVYERDRNTCVSCGWHRDQWSRDDPRILELHHIEEHAGGGANTEENLVVVCSRCHDDVHAGRIRMRVTSDGVRCDRVVGDG